MSMDKIRRQAGIILVLAILMLLGSFSMWFFLYRQANQDRSYSGAKFIKCSMAPTEEQTHAG